MASPLQAEPLSPASLEICFAPGTPEAVIREIGRKRLAAHPELHKARPVQRIASTALDPGGSPMGRGLRITWSYVPDGTIVPGEDEVPGEAPSHLFARMNQQFPGGFEQWHALFVRAFKAWGAVSGNVYVYEAADDGAPLHTSPGVHDVRGDVRIAMRAIPGAILGYNAFPDSGSDMVLDSLADGELESFDLFTAENLVHVVLHEHGHGLGLAHVCPIDGTKIMEPNIAQGGTLPAPQWDDILGVQRLYGDVLRADGSANTASNAIRSRRLLLGVAASNDADWFRIEGPGPVRLRVVPIEASYPEAAQNADEGCPAGNVTDLSSLGDLVLTAYRDDATSQIVQADAAPAGGTEAIVYRGGPGDTHTYVRVDNTGSGYQLYVEAISVGHVLPLITSAPPEVPVFADGFEAPQ